MSLDFKNFLELRENKNKGLEKLPERKTESVEHTLFIDSRHRNRQIYPLTSQFALKIDSGTNTDATINHKYRNISEIYLTTTVLPIKVKEHPYIILEIPELNASNVGGTNNLLDRAFAILIPETHHNDGAFVNSTVHYLDNHKHIYKPPLASLPQTLTITLYDPNGNILDTGVDNAYTLAVKNTVQTFFIIKVICKENSFDSINSRIV